MNDTNNSNNEPKKTIITFGNKAMVIDVNNIDNNPELLAAMEDWMKKKEKALDKKFNKMLLPKRTYKKRKR